MTEYLEWQKANLKAADVACWGSFLRNEAGVVLTALPLRAEGVHQLSELQEMLNDSREKDAQLDFTLVAGIAQSWPPELGREGARGLSCSSDAYYQYLEKTAHLGGTRPFPVWVSPEYSIANFVLYILADATGEGKCSVLSRLETMDPDVRGKSGLVEGLEECQMEGLDPGEQALADTRLAGEGFGLVTAGKEVPVVEATDNCPEQEEDVDLEACNEGIDEDYGRVVSQPLEWGAAAGGQLLWHGRFACASGAEAQVERIVGGAVGAPEGAHHGEPSLAASIRSSTATDMVDKWKVKCPGLPEEIIYANAIVVAGSAPLGDTPSSQLRWQLSPWPPTKFLESFSKQKTRNCSSRVWISLMD
jgi:hypothetical protein